MLGKGILYRLWHTPAGPYSHCFIVSFPATRRRTSSGSFGRPPLEASILYKISLCSTDILRLVQYALSCHSTLLYVATWRGTRCPCYPGAGLQALALHLQHQSCARAPGVMTTLACTHNQFTFLQEKLLLVRQSSPGDAEWCGTSDIFV